ncbi:Glutamate synthase [NADPH] large chain [Fulvivirga imtechensis AK7]|uniref:Glutamate synthase [NADPH] large chain n=1 Tax=Fulvivirga imtechensis AK7 TaxID=1237149 RepID=L8JTA7_9BACT|nr:glutamate synthase large subunit [Fulvivirga imtechensis]ELR72211.1 Glutamate synthase [NADPH] large chain [Fulvivirga imtechensis AK7]
MRKLQQRGLYTPELEHDACGIGCIANIDGKKTAKTVQDALDMLENMEHRGGTGSDPETGDGAGILIQIPHHFYKNECEKLGITLPEFGAYGVGMLFFPTNKSVREECKSILEKHAKELGFEVLGYRPVPVDHNVPGAGSSKVEPVIEQIFVKHKDNLTGDNLERKLFVFRNYTTHYIGHHVKGNNADFYSPSFSHKIVVYKGQLRTNQVRPYYYDLQNEEVKSSLAIVHSRYSTNTFPNWKLAQPFRYIAHNGEINTIRGNVTKMKSKEAMMGSDLFTDEELKMLLPVTDPTHSDSANLDALVEMLVLSGRSLPHVMMMLVPEAWEDNPLMDTERKAFYKYHASLMEPWDGPAALVFTDGKVIGATLDRNGLRPGRYYITKDDRLIIASEAGALPVKPSNIISKGRMQPGKMLIADLEQKKVVYDEEVKAQISHRQPYVDWIKQHRVKLRLIPTPTNIEYSFAQGELELKQKAFGYTSEELKIILSPMAVSGTEPVGSMGADTPLAVLSDQSQHISNYFKQLFAQVSNPPIDPIRERMVMSLFTRVGESLNILAETPEHTKQIHISQPVLLNSDLQKFKNLDHIDFPYSVLPAVFEADGKPGRLEAGLDKLCRLAEEAVISGSKVLIISDRNINNDYAPIPSLLSTGAVHHHLVDKNLRTKAGIIIEAGDVRETHHFATIIGYGASAINPYLALETIKDLHEKEYLDKELTLDQAFANYQKAIGYGLLKVLSKMGISTLQSYQASQIFEALGLNQKVINRCFKGTISRIEGIGFDGIAHEVLTRHHSAWNELEENSQLQVGGVYQWKRRGEKHMFNPATIHLLQHSTKTNNFELYKKYANKINDQTRHALTLRGLLDFKPRNAVPIEEVEPKESIFKRFATGAMSFGSISHEAHTTLAIAMNRIGAKSNSGEGGEDEVRFEPKPNGDSERSAIKQVASGRFGVTSYYLTNADEIQIKMAQGAKPGEGGQLPGHKVDEWIGRVRHSTPGVGLISPPPHHDIYSIEDLAQLIYDLKNANRNARINVKLVSEAGVGTVAAGVSKANADVVLISGADGGTGASPLSSIRHAGLPWELGLAEVHQTLVKNDLRSRITVQTDGQLRTGKDLAIATLLGAEEWGISTAALVVEGCIMMRKCHLNTCPVGIATQNPELRKLFTGNPDHVVNFFTFLAEDLRQIMAQLGFRTIDEMVGRTEVLRLRDNIAHWKFKDLDLSPILYREDAPEYVGVYKQMEQDHELEKALDWELLEAAKPALGDRQKVFKKFSIKNTNRSVGAILSNEISKKYKGEGLPEDTIHFNFRGSAGQTFGGFLTSGVKFELEGEANDYFGKGLCGGRLVTYPDKTSTFKAEENIIIGNVAFYGATKGEAYIRGMAGERFCVRNSGVEVVVEGVGDHACEYMTGGKAVILGPTGKNFAAGMSGGIAYVYDQQGQFEKLCNKGMVSLDPLDAEDQEKLETMIKKHVEYTESEVGKRILAQWPLALKSFIKVIPNDYKAILMKKKEPIKVAV